MGLLDFNMNLDPKTQGLLGLGQGLLQSSGWSPTPISMGQAMGQGLQSGLSAYTGAQQQQLQNQLAQQKLQQKPTSLMQNVVASGKAAGTPEYQAAIDAYLGKQAGTNVITNVNQGGKTRFLTTEEKAAAGIPQDVAAQVDPKGKVSTAFKATEKEMDVAGYTRAAESALHQVSKINGSTPAGTWAAGNLVARNIPGLVTPADKQMYDSQLAWTWNVLRVESGGTVTKEEAETAIGIYWPQPGDDDATQANKEVLRQGKAEAMKQRSGQSYKQFVIPAQKKADPLGLFK